MKRSALHSRLTRRTLLCTAVAALPVALGCELAVDFDRTKVPTVTVDATVADVVNPPPGDAGRDGQGNGDANAEGGDAAADAPADAPAEAAADAADAGTDAQDAAADAASDAPDDAPSDSGGD